MKREGFYDFKEIVICLGRATRYFLTFVLERKWKGLEMIGAFIEIFPRSTKSGSMQRWVQQRYAERKY